MKKIIKNFLFKRRFKVLKNKKGFSLVEILVAVSIIGIIGAIAYPQFQDYRANASKVAGDTSIGNIERAFQNCIVLKTFAQCDSLSDLGVACADCSDSVDSNTNPTKFCAAINKTIGGDQFKVCAQFEGSKRTAKSYGGSLFKDIKVCADKVTGCTGSNAATVDNINHIQAEAKECTGPGQCTAGSYTCKQTGTPSVSAACVSVNTSGGTCASGVCAF